MKKLNQSTSDPSSPSTATASKFPPVTFLVCSKHPIEGVFGAMAARDLLTGAEPSLLCSSAVVRQSPVALVDVVPLVAIVKGVPRILNQKALLAALKRGGRKDWPKVNPSQKMSVVQMEDKFEVNYLDALEYCLEARVTTNKVKQEQMIDMLADGDVLLENVREICGIWCGKQKVLGVDDVMRIFLLKEGTARNRLKALNRLPDANAKLSIDAKKEKPAQPEQLVSPPQVGESNQPDRPDNAVISKLDLLEPDLASKLFLRCAAEYLKSLQPGERSAMGFSQNLINRLENRHFSDSAVLFDVLLEQDIKKEAPKALPGIYNLVRRKLGR